MSKIKPYRELTFTDDFMFGKVMQNPDICKHVLELVLGIQIHHIVYLEEQKFLKPAYEAKGIRLDVYVDDGQNTIYNVEMQTQHFSDLPKRSRYYQSVVDLDLLAEGQGYRSLKNNIIIFICTGDIFGSGRCYYSFENICREDKELQLKDGTLKIFLNAAGILDRKEIRPELQKFLDYISTGQATDDFTRQLEYTVDTARKNREWEVNYMTLALKFMDEREDGRLEGLEQGRQEGLEQGRQEGLEQGLQLLQAKQLETCRKALKMKFSIADIMELTGMSEEEIQTIAKEM